jgi:hypothetical protein
MRSDMSLAPIPSAAITASSDFECLAVSDFPSFDYSKKEVRRAGDIIAGSLPWSDETRDEILHAFQIANNWRNAHAYPMRSIRASIVWCMSRHSIKGLTAARLKRMQAIRRKLKRVRLNLEQYQDLGGCRAILSSVDDVRRVREFVRQHSRHEVRNENDYISEPKDDGYRGIHTILLYRGRGEDRVFDDRRIEVQLRTEMQHSWATGIEAVGLFRGEDLKAGQGDARWLRLFHLMSAEIAEAEGCPLPPDAPSQQKRRTEIRDLSLGLDALNDLDKLGHAVDWAAFAVQPIDKPKYYLLKYDRGAGLVSVSPHNNPIEATDSYGQAELDVRGLDRDDAAIVLIEADKIENLKHAFPNYFGDVRHLRNRLQMIVEGETGKVYTVKRQEVVPPRPKERPDQSWLRRRNLLLPKNLRDKKSRS